MLGFDTTNDVSSRLGGLKGAGVTAIGRYYSVNAWKVVKKPEAQAVGSAGVALWVVYQDANNKVSSFSKPKGEAAAANALAYATGTIGQPHGSAIYFAVDYDATAAHIAGPITDYFRAVRHAFQAAGNPYRVGVYGSGATCGALLDANLADLAWLSMSTGHAGYDGFYASGRWALAQKKEQTIAGIEGDTNEINPANADFGGFSLAAPALPASGALAPAAGADVSFAATRFPGGVFKRGQFNSPTVALIQRRLNEVLHLQLVEDGDFGEATENAVKLFQARYSDPTGGELEVDGEVGKLTWGALFGAETLFVAEELRASGSLRELVLQVAASQVGVREQPPGSNRGPQVDEYIRASGLDPARDSYPWCICFLQWIFREAAKARNESTPLPQTAGVHALWQMRNQGSTDVVKPDETGSSAIRPGMIFLFDTGGGKGHAGIVESVAGDRIVSIEGNTNTGGSREGVGVFRRSTRRINMANLLGYLDFCP